MRAIVLGIVALAAVTTAADAKGWHTYRDPQGGWSISYPNGWRVDANHIYSALGPGKEIHGVAFVVPRSFVKGTNLGDDSYLAVETLPSAAACRASEFLDDTIDQPRLVAGSNGITWSVQDGADAGAGNVYEETVQAAIGSKPCIATRAWAHSANIANFDPGTVKAFDRRAFNSIMDRMRHSFRILR
ncbi:MAG: hypothetical protein ACTHLR_02860 [Rhizomicrobium sp.]